RTFRRDERSLFGSRRECAEPMKWALGPAERGIVSAAEEKAVAVEREGVSSQIGVDELRGAAAPPPTGPAGDEPQPLERQLRVTVEVPRGLRPCAGPDSMVLQDPAEPVRGHSHLLKFLKRADQRLAVAARGGVEPVQVAAVLTQEPRGVLHQGLDLRLPPGEGPVPAGEDLLQLLPGERG